MNITYEELKELLLIGHEIEFEYNKKNILLTVDKIIGI